MAPNTRTRCQFGTNLRAVDSWQDLQVVKLASDPEVAAAEVVHNIPNLHAEQVRDSPFMLVARTTEQAADELLDRPVGASWRLGI